MSQNHSKLPPINDEQRDALRNVVREKLIQKQQKESRSWIKIIRISTFFCISFNAFLLCDILVFPPIRESDKIVSTEVLQVRDNNYNTVQIFTALGKFWTIKYSKFDFTGHTISYTKTPFFSITYDIGNHHSGYMIQRMYPARELAICAAAMSILFSFLGLILHRKKKNKIADHLLQLAIIITGVELILLMI